MDGPLSTSTSRILEPVRLSAHQRFWRSRRIARIRHRLALRPLGVFIRAHAVVIRWSGGRIRRSFLFTGGMPVLVLTTTGRRSGKDRSVPLGYLRVDTGFAVIASNAGSDRVPGWWLNLQAQPVARVLAGRAQHAVTARPADPDEDVELWARFAALNPGFDEYRKLTTRTLPVVILDLTGPPSIRE